MPTEAFCSGCMCVQRVDANWRALWIDSDGDLIATRPEFECNLDFERPRTAFACGQGAALRIVERYLHAGTFELAPTLDDSIDPVHITPDLSGEDLWIAHLT